MPPDEGFGRVNRSTNQADTNVRLVHNGRRGCVWSDMWDYANGGEIEYRRPSYPTG